MTWNLGGYWGEEVAIRDTGYHFIKDTSANRHFFTPYAPQQRCHSERSEESPSRISVLSKRDLQTLFYKFHIIFEL